MKIRIAQFIPFGIAAIVILLTIALHLFSRRLADSEGPGGRAMVEQLEWITYDARVRLAPAFLDQSTVAPNLATLFIDDLSIELINSGKYARYLAPAEGEDISLDDLYFRPPWPRFIYGQLVRELTAQGGIAIGFDILFPEKDEFNPIEQVHDSEYGPVTSDLFFALELERSGRAILAAQADLLPVPEFAQAADGIASIASHPDNGVLRRVRAFQLIREWHPLLLDLAPKLDLKLNNALVEGSTLVIPRKPTAEDLNPEPFLVPLNPNGTIKLLSDGTINVGDEPEGQGSATELPFTEKRIWNLGLVLAARALELDLDSAEITPRGIALRGPKTSRFIPTDARGYFHIDWSLRFEDIKEGRTPVYYGHLPEVLIYDKFRQTGETDIPARFGNRIVVIGSVATGNNMSDIGSTPLEQNTPLVTKHLNIANSIITNRFVYRLGPWAEAGIIAALGLFSAFITWRTRVLMASIGIAALSLAFVLAAILAYVEHRWWVAMVMPLFGGLILPHFALVSYRVIFEQREQRRVRGIFSRIVSPEVVQELLSAERLALGGARREISVFFADVRGFTEFTESSRAAAEEYVRAHQLAPAEAERFFDEQAAETLRTVNLYLAIIADTVKKHDGTLDKYIGDCVMAFWGAPIPNPRHAFCCVQAAIEAQRAIGQLNQQRALENTQRHAENIERVASGRAPLPPLALLTLGTGISTGNAVVGLMGSDNTILNYTVFGRDVNLASRLEALSGRGRIMISEATFLELCRDDPALASSCQELEPAIVKGFRHAVRIFEVPWAPKSGKPAELDPVERSPRAAVSTAAG